MRSLPQPLRAFLLLEWGLTLLVGAGAVVLLAMGVYEWGEWHLAIPFLAGVPVLLIVALGLGTAAFLTTRVPSRWKILAQLPAILSAGLLVWFCR